MVHRQDRGTGWPSFLTLFSCWYCLCPRQVKGWDSLTHSASEAIGAGLGRSEGRHQDLVVFACFVCFSFDFLETMSYSLLQASPKLSTAAQASSGLTEVLLPQPPLELQL